MVTATLHFAVGPLLSLDPIPAEIAGNGPRETLALRGDFDRLVDSRKAKSPALQEAVLEYARRTTLLTKARFDTGEASETGAARGGAVAALSSNRAPPNLQDAEVGKRGQEGQKMRERETERARTRARERALLGTLR